MKDLLKKHGGRVNRAPTNATIPAVTGTVTIGQTLTVSTGEWNNAPTSFSYQWFSGGAAVGGATASTYVIQASDAGKAIYATVTGINNMGQFIATSNTTANVPIAAPVNSVAPVITGAATQGTNLTSTNGTWSGSPSFTYQWKRGASNIAGATTSSYTLVVGDVGATITLVVTATNGGGSANATSNGIGPVS